MFSVQATYADIVAAIRGATVVVCLVCSRYQTSLDCLSGKCRLCSILMFRLYEYDAGQGLSVGFRVYAGANLFCLVTGQLVRDCFMKSTQRPQNFSNISQLRYRFEQCVASHYFRRL